MPVVAIEVRDVGELDREPALVGLDDVAVHRQLDLAEVAAERDLLLVGELLVVEHQHGIAIHAGLDRRDLVGLERPAQIDAADLADEQRMQLANLHGHVLPPSSRTGRS